jgi:hypothetical protein
MSEPESMGGGEWPVTPKPKRRRRVLRIRRIIIVLMALYVLVFILGRPKPTVDYLALLNEMTKVEGRSEADNAWADYEKTFQLHVFDENDAVLKQVRDRSLQRFEDLNEAQKQATENWIARNEEAWQAFGRAANKPYYRKEYRYRVGPNESKSDNAGSKSLLDYDGSDVPKFNHMRILGRWRIAAHLSQGHVQQALDDCVVLIKVGTQRNGMQPRVTLDSLVNAALCSEGYEGLIAVLKQDGSSGVDWAGLNRQLHGMRPNPESVADLGEWHLESLDLIQRFFTSWGIGGGHLVIDWPWFDRGVIDMSWRDRAIMAPVAFFHARRHTTSRKWESMYQQMNQTLRLTPYQRKISGLAETYMPAVPDNALGRFIPGMRFCRYAFIGVFVPAIDRFVEKAHELRALHDAVVTIIAVKRYQADKGHCPDALDELVQAGYLAYMPPDPYSDKPLIYRKTEDGFILYSVGQNMKDDGGHAAISSSLSVRQWGTEKEGDAVLWPPQ